MNLRSILLFFVLFPCGFANAVTECDKKIRNYFIGTSQLNESVAHLWVNYEEGGSAAVRTESAAFDSMLSTVITSIVADKKVRVRYLADNADCQQHHTDWVGLWMFK